jgi:PAS domain S-box-containing protein
MKIPVKVDKQLQQVFDNSPFGVVVFDATYHLLWINLSFCEMTTSSKAELVNRSIVDIIHPDDIDKMMQLAQHLFASEISSFDIEQRWINKNGETLWFDWVVTIVGDEVGGVSLAVAMVKNISHDKQMEAAYQYLRKRINQIEHLATIGRLVSTLTHEINNSMHVVQGLLNLCLEELDNPIELSSYLNMSLTESAKVVELAGRLRYSYRALPDPPESVDLNGLLEAAVPMAHRELRRKNIRIHTRLAAELPAITSRASQLYLIFLSLILNMAELLVITGSGEIEIRSGLVPEGVQVVLSAQTDHVATSTARLWPEEPELDLSLSFSRDKLIELGGNLSLQSQDGGIICTVKIPFLMPEDSAPIE